MNNENLTPRKDKRYDETFKRSAVELWLQGGKSVEQIATAHFRRRCAAAFAFGFRLHQISTRQVGTADYRLNAEAQRTQSYAESRKNSLRLSAPSAPLRLFFPPPATNASGFTPRARWRSVRPVVRP